MKNLVCTLFLMTCLFQNGYSQSKTYYVDSQSGNDSDNGNTEQTAWQTITKVNSVTFQPGDKILFKAGSVWDNAILWPKGSGVKDAPIIIDAYGGDISDEKNKPHIKVNHRKTTNVGLPYLYAIDNDTPVSAGLILHNVSYWEVNNLQISNDGDIPELPTGWWLRDMLGVFLSSRNYGVMEHIYIRNLYIHNIRGYASKAHSSGKGIFALSSGSTSFQNTPDDIPSSFNDLRIENNRLERVTRSGIVTSKSSFYNRRWSNSDPIPEPTAPHAVPTNSTNVIIRGNLLEGIGGDGIIAAATNGALVERNIVRGGMMYTGAEDEVIFVGPGCGIWTYDSDNCVIQYNVVSGMMDTCDGQAFDIDYYTTNTLIQYNYSHNNAGGFLLLCSPGYSVSSGNVIRYNISQNDGSAYGWYWKDTGRTFHFNGGNTDTHIYNNTFYIGEEQNGYKIVATDQWYGGRPVNINFENNIFIVESEDMYKFFTNNEWPLNNIPSIGPPDLKQFVWNNNAFIGKGFEPGTQVGNTVPTINQNSPLILTDDASHYFYGAGQAMFSIESAIAAYTPKPNTALTDYTGQTVAEPDNLRTTYHLADGTPFNPGAQEWPYSLYDFYNYNPSRDFAGNTVNISQPRQLGAILASEEAPYGVLLDAPTITVQATHAGIEVTFTTVADAEKYTLIYGKTQGFGYQARIITKTPAELGGNTFVLDYLNGEGDEFFDEYLFKVCAVDAEGKDGYLSFEKRLVINRTGTGDDPNPYYRDAIPTLDAMVEELPLTAATFIAVTSISGIPSGATTESPFTLTATVTPSYATNQAIVWSVKDAGTTGATITDGTTINTTASGTLVVTATIAAGRFPAADYVQDFTIVVSFVSVTNITGVPSSATAGEPLTLTGTINPSNAANRTIIWSMKNAGVTGATITDGATFNATATGVAIVTATINAGKSPNEDYVKDFSIVVTGNVTGTPELTPDTPLCAWIRNGLLHVTGLTAGEVWSVYSVSGALIYQNIVASGEADIPLGVQGVYIVQSGESTVRVVFD